MTPLYLSLLLAQTEAKPLTLTLPVGTKITAELELVFEDKADEFTMTTRDSFVTVVEKLEGEHYTLQHKITPTYLKIDDLERKSDNMGAADVTEKRTRFGVVTELDGTLADPNANLLIAQLWSIPLPRSAPKVGSDWTFEDNRQPHPFRFTGLVKYELEGRIVFDTSVQGLFSNTLKAKGTAVLDLATGWPMRIELKAQNALVPGGERERMNLALRYETTSIEKPKS